MYIFVLLNVCCFYFFFVYLSAQGHLFLFGQRRGASVLSFISSGLPCGQITVNVKHLIEWPENYMYNKVYNILIHFYINKYITLLLITQINDFSLINFHLILFFSIYKKHFHNDQICSFFLKFINFLLLKKIDYFFNNIIPEYK